MTRGPTPDQVEAWNDQFAREHDIDAYYEDANFLIRRIEARRLAVIREMIPRRPGARLLEVGCGGGHVLRLFPEARGTGVDPSGEMLAKARRNLSGQDVELLKGELHELDLPEASFDHLICTEVLEHVVDPEGLLERMATLLQPPGIAVITLPNDAIIDRLKAIARASGIALLPGFRRLSWGGDDYHLHEWTIPEMRELLGRAFRVEREVHVPGRWLPVRCCFACRRLDRSR